jgi:transposase
VARRDLTNAQWAKLEPLLPVGKKPGRPPVRTKRQLIDGIRWRTRAGAPWRDVPERYGPWETVYGLFRRWQRDGTWHRIYGQLQARADAEGLTTWDVSVDSTIARAHQLVGTGTAVFAVLAPSPHRRPQGRGELGSHPEDGWSQLWKLM